MYIGKKVDNKIKLGIAGILAILFNSWIGNAVESKFFTDCKIKFKDDHKVGNLDEFCHTVEAIAIDDLKRNNKKSNYSNSWDDYLKKQDQHFKKYQLEKKIKDKTSLFQKNKNEQECSKQNVLGYKKFDNTKTLLGLLGDFKEQVSWENTNCVKEVVEQGMLPRGSAVLTESGNLSSKAIKAIIHAASGSKENTYDSEENSPFIPTLKGISDSVKNSLVLAKKHNHKKIAIPFIGSGIFLDRIPMNKAEENSKLEKIAEILVESVKSSNTDLEIIFVAHDEKNQKILEKALLNVKSDKQIKVVKGSITEFFVHGASVIVNPGNMEGEFVNVGGTSKVIKEAVGITHAETINKNLHNIIQQFNLNYCSNVLNTNKKSAKKVPSNEIGLPVEKYYTPNYNSDGGAYSDHAPVIYGEVVTWNIAQKGSFIESNLGKKMFNGKSGFYNHKFSNLEIETDDQYEERLQRISKIAIPKLFDDNNLKAMVLQELPFSQNKEKKDFLKHFMEELNNKGYELKVDGGQGIIVRKGKIENVDNISTNFHKFKNLDYHEKPAKPKQEFDEKVIDRLKTEYQLDIKPNSAQNKAIKRMSHFYVPGHDVMYVSVHLPFDVQGEDICKMILAESHELRDLKKYDGNFKTIKFIGDFNHSAEELRPKCNKLNITKIYSTANEEAFSAGEDGDNPKNIDLMVQVDL